MATTGTATESRDAADLASDLHDAELVRVVSRADGDGLAAATILGDALADRDIPRHLSLAPSRNRVAPRLEGDDTAIVLGFPDFEQSCNAESAATCAFEMAQELGTDPDPGLALAGGTVAGVRAQDPALSAAQDRGLTQRPGLAIPTADMATGLAYTGWLHAEFSGDEAATSEFVADLDLPEPMNERGHRMVASAVALEATDTLPSERATKAIANAVGPRTTPTAFETIGGYADVLNAAAKMDAGAALASLLTGAESRLLEMWQVYGAKVHEVVAELPQTETPVQTATVEGIPPDDVARLGRDFRVPADQIYVEGPETIALATREETAIETLENRVPEAAVSGTNTLATVRTDADLETILTDTEAGQ
ncbi:hypothetical protein [Halodesulfurarchaeum sp.]|uniref:hypothetical protein n=1 Tax=Halodesulfurarchaeum sp. TaxID=1980530 RepID=UPI002FC3AD9E